jgi:large subunit ribosomal protein L6
MSRIGKQPIPLPSAVKANVLEGLVEVQGPKGKTVTPVPAGITCKVDGGILVVTRQEDTKQGRAFHGLTRALLANAVRGVSEGYKKELDIVGVGYKAALDGKKLNLSLGFSHPVDFLVPEGITITVEKNTHVTVTGHDRQQVGQVAAQIRAYRKCEPYKGKGVKYSDETVVRKAGKAAK